MLCSRPNEDLYIQKEKYSIILFVKTLKNIFRPFISRVDHKNQLGVNPIQKIYNLATKTRIKFFKKLLKRD